MKVSAEAREVEVGSGPAVALTIGDPNVSDFSGTGGMEIATFSIRTNAGAYCPGGMVNRI